MCSDYLLLCNKCRDLKQELFNIFAGEVLGEGEARCPGLRVCMQLLSDGDRHGIIV